MIGRAAIAVATLLAVLAPVAGLGEEPAGRPLPTFQGVVIGVVDGDTVDVLVSPETARAIGFPPRKSPKDIRLRLYGIDAPEKGQPLGKQAKQVLSDLVFRKEVTFALVVPDDFGRLVALIAVGDTEMNELMVRRGYAWAFRQYLGKLTNDERYCVAEAAARSEQLGLWRLPEKERRAPWEYRKWQRGRAVRYTKWDAETAESCVASFERK